MAHQPLHLPVADEALPTTYERFRAAGPVVSVLLPGGVPAWAVTTHTAVREVMAADNRLFGKHSSHWGALGDGAVPADWPLLPLVLGEHLLAQDGATHRRLRGLLTQAFTPHRVEALRPRVERIVAGLLDAIAVAGAGGAAVDLVAAFTERLPMAVICELFGIPEPERDAIRRWTRELFAHHDSAGRTHAARRELIDYLGGLVAAKRQALGDDLTSGLVRARDRDDRLSEQELVDCLFLLLIAGHETTVHLLGHAVVSLLGHPEQLAAAIAGERWDDVVEETLRRTPPVAGVMFRYALAPLRVAGVPIAAGEPMLLCIGGAATDPEQHGTDADGFDIDRVQRGHLAFGHGPHFCLGAPLARLEATVGLAALFTRWPRLTAAVALADLPYSPSFVTYGPLALPVRVAPAGDVAD